MNSLTPQILFLHGGPGMTAELERRQFGPSLAVHWWDQPLVRAGADRAFEALIDAAEVEIVRLSTKREGRIDLLANSFGAYLARALVELRTLAGRWGSRAGLSSCGGGGHAAELLR